LVAGGGAAPGGGGGVGGGPPPPTVRPNALEWQAMHVEAPAVPAAGPHPLGCPALDRLP
jgi:hypothetical protein